MGPEYSAYPDEEEVLLYDGLEFSVIGFEDKPNETGRRVIDIKLYNDSRPSKENSELKNTNFDLVKQEWNN